MSPLLFVLLGVLLAPLFVASWRTSLIGLSAQGLLMAWIACLLAPSPGSVDEWITLVDLILVRGLWAPLALYSVLRAQRAPARNDVIPANLLSWTLALGMVLVAFKVSDLLVAGPGDQRTLVAVASAGVMLGFLVLATQSGLFSQIVGALRIENAIALFELGGGHHPQPLGVRLGLVASVVVTIALYRGYLARLNPGAAAMIPAAAEDPTL